MKVKSLFIILFIIVHFRSVAQTPKGNLLYIDFKNNIALKTISNISYEELKKKDYKIKYPKLNGQFQEFIKKEIEKSIEEYTCEDSGFFEIDYKITFLTSDFISIIKKVNINCSDSPSPFIFEGSYNLMTSNNKLYQVTLNSTKTIINLINKKMNKECLEDHEMANYFDYIVKSNKTYIINPVEGRECFTHIEFTPSEKLFKFSIIKK